MNVSWLSNSCRRRRRDIALLASGVLAEDQRDRVEAHLMDCARCRRYREELDRLAVNLQSLGGSRVHAEPTPALRARWRRAVRAAPQPDLLSGAVGAVLAFGRAFAKRPVWAGLAGVWLMILFFQVTSPAVAELPSTGPVPAPRELYLALCNPDWPRFGAAEEPANPRAKEPKPAPLKPRSEQRSGTKAA
jgi:anti-sigma factor RsiW